MPPPSAEPHGLAADPIAPELFVSNSSVWGSVFDTVPIFFEPACEIGNGQGRGHSEIYFDANTNLLTAGASTTYYTFAQMGESPCSVSGTLSGPGVSLSGSDPNCNAAISFSSSAAQPNSTYCIAATHASVGGSCSTSSCLTTPGPRVASLSFERILTDDANLDANPKIGDGYRFFPDKKSPSETGIDRRRIRVRAQFTEATSGVRIYFRSFDVDDPSSETAPLDPVDTSATKAGNDNNGLIDGLSGTNAGRLTAPVGSSGCQLFPDGISCLTDANGVALVDFTMTMQPGDNFAVVAGPNEAYVSGLALKSDGINLADTAGETIPADLRTGNQCLTANVSACRTDMLTVWRRLHIEVDSMGNVGHVNNETGTATSSITIPASTGLTPGIGTISVSTNLEVDRFQLGRIVFDDVSLLVNSNTTNSVTALNNGRRPVHIAQGAAFILYDDDDYNRDDTQISNNGDIISWLVDGDSSEAVVKFNETLALIRTSDNPAENIYAAAYVRPEYVWAEQMGFSENDLGFSLNVSSDSPDEATALINANRQSEPKEGADFWVAYFLIAYQGPLAEDADPDTNRPEVGVSKTLGSSPVCDCLIRLDGSRGSCPASEPQPLSCSITPLGAFGSLVYLETQQDVRRTWALTGSDVENRAICAPHELGPPVWTSG